jgi:DEAD/DEAH box helicase domain-containing protein
VVEPAPEIFEAAVKSVTLRLQNEIGGLRQVEPESVRAFLLGFLLNLKNRGGVWHDALEPYVRDLGNAYVLPRVGDRQLYMPRYSPWSRLPEFLMPWAVGKSRFLVLGSVGRGTPSWHQEWLRRCFNRVDPNIVAYVDAAYRAALKELVARGVMFEYNTGRVPVWGITQESLRVNEEVRQLRCDAWSFLLSVGPDVAVALSGCRCPHLTCHRGCCASSRRRKTITVGWTVRVKWRAFSPQSTRVC